jgi:hypothetical protein
MQARTFLGALPGSLLPVRLPHCGIELKVLNVHDRADRSGRRHRVNQCLGVPSIEPDLLWLARSIRYG